MRKEGLSAELKPFQGHVTHAIQASMRPGTLNGIGDGNDDGRDEELQFGADESPMQLEAQPIEIDERTRWVFRRSMRGQVTRQAVDDDVERHIHRPILTLIEDVGAIVFFRRQVADEMTTAPAVTSAGFIMRGAQFESIEVADLLVFAEIVFFQIE